MLVDPMAASMEEEMKGTLGVSSLPKNQPPEPFYEAWKESSFNLANWMKLRALSGQDMQRRLRLNQLPCRNWNF